MTSDRIPHWQLLRSTPMFDGYTRVRRDTYRLPDGSESDWDVLEQRDTVAVVAFTTAGTVLVFEQFRVGPAAPIVELPGGLIDPGESALVAGARELAEEVGLRLDETDLVPLGEFSAPAANEPGFEVVADVFRVDIGDQTPVAAAEIAELRWVTRAEASEIDVAPLAAAYFLPEA